MIGLGQTLRGEARDAVIFAGSNLLNRVGALLLLPLYWTKLSPADYGVLAVIAVFGAFQTLLSSISLDLGVTRFYYEWAEDLRRRNLGAIWTWNLLITLAVTIAFLLIVPTVGPALFPEVTDRSWFVLGVLGNAGSNLFIIPASTIRIKRLPWLFASYNLLGFALATGLGLWLVLVLDQGLTGLLVSTLAANLILAIVGVAAMLRFSTPALSSPGLREAVRFSAHALPSALISTSASILDRFLLGLFTNLQTLGLYSVASRFVDVLNALHSALKMSYGPFLMKNISTEGRRGVALVVAITPYYLIPYFVVGLGLSLFINPVVRLIGQPEYFGVESIVPWLVGIQILACLPAYIANGITLGKRTELLSIPAAASLAVLAALSLALIGPLQLAGIIVSRYASIIAFLGLSLYLSQKVFPMGHRWRTLLQLATTAIAFSVVGQVVLESGADWEIPAKALLWCLYIGIAWWIVGRGAAAPVSPSPSGAPV